MVRMDLTRQIYRCALHVDVWSQSHAVMGSRMVMMMVMRSTLAQTHRVRHRLAGASVRHHGYKHFHLNFFTTVLQTNSETLICHILCTDICDSVPFNFADICIIETTYHNEIILAIIGWF